MKILAIETSTEYCSVALWQDGALSERCELVGQKHSEVLLAMLDALLKEADVTLNQLDGIAFGKGPGSFTGVRIACGVAQGLALGTNLQVVGVCTLEALAQAAGHDKVIAALDARMGEIYFAAYEKRHEDWQTVIEPCLCKAENAPVIEGENWVGAGSGFALASSQSTLTPNPSPGGRGELETSGGRGELATLNEGGELAVRYAGQLSGVDASVVPRASAVAQLAAIEFSKGHARDAALALPFYLRDKVALKTSER